MKIQPENRRYQNEKQAMAIAPSCQLPDEESPLYEFSARDISSKMQFEIILTMEGITPETGNTIQVGKKKGQKKFLRKKPPQR